MFPLLRPLTCLDIHAILSIEVFTGDDSGATNNSFVIIIIFIFIFFCFYLYKY